MEAIKIGIREFRENLAGYLESGTPLVITRHGETVGFYIPAQRVGFHLLTTSSRNYYQFTNR